MISYHMVAPTVTETILMEVSPYTEVTVLIDDRIGTF